MPLKKAMYTTTKTNNNPVNNTYTITRYLGFTLSLVAIGLFFPGILLPMFNLTMDMTIAVSGTGINSQLVDKELSIVTTVTQLWQQNRYLVSALIFLFSIVIPIVKTSALCYVFFAKNRMMQQKIANFVASVGKWSMADVFVVAVFLAVLSTNHTENAEQHGVSFFGIALEVDISTQTLSMVGQGFYFFTAYCVLSLLGSQLLLKSVKPAVLSSP